MLAFVLAAGTPLEVIGRCEDHETILIEVKVDTLLH